MNRTASPVAQNNWRFQWSVLRGKLRSFFFFHQRIIHFHLNRGIQHILFTILAFGVTLALFSFITDPYARPTLIRSPYSTQLNDQQQLKVIEHASPTFTAVQEYVDDPFQPVFERVSQLLAYVRAGVRIAAYSLLGEGRLRGSETEIIEQIHRKRFDPSKPYVITGGHYSDLYMRNLGIFYNAISDPYIPSSEEDWLNRQRITLQTLVFDLEYIKKMNEPVTTIVPLLKTDFTGVNIYAYPSDSLFAVVYTLKTLRDSTYFQRYYSPTTTPQHTLVTQQVTQGFIQDFQLPLTRVINGYLQKVLDPQTKLIKADLHLSSARDGVKRSSSFYDNVIAWATVQTAHQLNMPVHDPLPPDEWKQKIIETYWMEDQGIFRDDLRSPNFSADSFIVLSTGFLDVNDAEDRQKLERMVAYVKANRLDDPFPLRYSKSNNNTAMHWPVRIFAPSYMGEGIWSHWGMEYIKTLILLGRSNPEYLTDAQRHLDSYKKNIEQFGGYPELYSKNGRPFWTPLLRAVRHTGWVINYEQAKAMLN